MVAVALPAIPGSFSVTLGQAGWVAIINSLIISAFMLPMGRAADTFGRLRMHLAGIAMFTTGAILVAVAPSFPLLLAGRAVMALGSVMGQSVGTAMIVAVFPTHERGTAIGSQTTAVAIGAASGPVLAGLILDVFSWQLLFIFLAIPAAIAALVMVMNNPLQLPWVSMAMAGLLLVALALAVAFVVRQRRFAYPMLRPEFFSDRLFSYFAMARVIGCMGTTGNFFLTPIFLISLRGLSPLTTGAVMFTNSVCLGVSAQLVGRLPDRFGGVPFV